MANGMCKTCRLKVEVINKVLLKSAVPALGRLNQEDHCEFETTLAYIEQDLVSLLLTPSKKKNIMPSSIIKL